MEHWLRESALPFPCGAFRRQKPVTEEPSSIAQHPVFFEFLRLRDEQLLHQIGVIQEVDSPESGAIVKDVSKLSRPFGIKRQGITGCQGEAACKQVPFGSGRKCSASRHGLHFISEVIRGNIGLQAIKRDKARQGASLSGGVSESFLQDVLTRQSAIQTQLPEAETLYDFYMIFCLCAISGATIT